MTTERFEGLPTLLLLSHRQKHKIFTNKKLILISPDDKSESKFCHRYEQHHELHKISLKIIKKIKLKMRK